MKKSFSKFFLVPVTALVLASFALTPVAEARGAGGGGGHGGGARAGGGGAKASARSGGGGNKQINNSSRDSRTTNVRNTSANNVNVNNRNTNINKNTNVNVDVDRHGGCCGGGWDNDYHPIATAAAVTATVAVTSAVIGSMVRTVPPNCIPVNYGGMIYQQCGTVWYQPQGTQYIVINAPY